MNIPYSWGHTFRKKSWNTENQGCVYAIPSHAKSDPQCCKGFRILGLLPTSKCKILGFFRIWWSYKSNCINIYIYILPLYMYTCIPVYSIHIQCIDICHPNWDLQTNLHPPLRQLLRIMTGAAALESLTFADVEAQKFADSVEEAPAPKLPLPTSLGFSRWMAFGWIFFQMRPQ